MTCTIEGCNSKLMAKGMCIKHYYRVKRGGTPEVSKKQQMALRKCGITDCGKPHFSNDLCGMHLRRKERHGDPLFINPVCNRDGNYIQRARAKTALWKKQNPGLNSAFTRQRKKDIKQATPDWVDPWAILQFYDVRPEGCQIDHIIPINSPHVCGLNVPWNLQTLTAYENGAKNNKFDFTYENESWRKDLKK